MNLKYLIPLLILSILWSCQESHPENLPDILKRANQQLDNQKYQKALVTLKRGDAIYSRDAPKFKAEYGDVLHLTGYTFIQLGQVDSAIHYFEQAVFVRQEVSGEMHVIVGISQFNLAYCWKELREYSKAIDLFHSAENIWQQDYIPDSTAYAILLDNLATCYFEIGNYQKAIDYGYQHLSVTRDSDKNYNIAKAYNHLGIWLRGKGDWRGALEQHERALQHLQKGHRIKSSPLLLARIYENMARCYELTGAIGKTMELYQKTLELRERNDDAPSFVATSLEDIGMIYSDYNRYKEAMEMVKSALKIRRQYQSADTLNSLQSICYCEMAGKDYEEAQKYCSQYLQNLLQKENNVIDTSSLILALSNLGKLSYLKKEYEQAIDYAQKAYRLGIEKYGQNHLLVAQACNYLGKTYAGIGQLDEAKKWLRQALASNHFDVNNFDRLIYFPDALNSLHELAEVYYKDYQQRRDVASLYQAQDQFQIAEDLLQYFHTKLGRDQFKRLLDEEAHTFYERSIRCSLELFRITDSIPYLHQAFYSAELAKTPNLMEAVKEIDAFSIQSIPDDIRNREYDLRVEIAYLEQQEPENPSSIEGDLLSLKLERDQLLKQLQEAYPEFYQLQYDISVPTIEQIQEGLLDQDQVLIEYFIGDSSSYAFIIQPNEIKVVNLPPSISLGDQISAFRSGIYNYFTKNTASLSEATQIYVSAAQTIYRALFAPVEAYISPEQRLIIIPDRNLLQIPFEALLREKPDELSDPENFDYLINRYSFSYSYSVQLLQEMRGRSFDGFSQDAFLGVAPGFARDSRPEFSTLQFNVEEVEKIKNKIGGKTLTGKAATEAAFKQLAPNYRILHLSTHGDSNLIAFSEVKDRLENEALFDWELYNLQLNAEMVVLSACKTGLGEIRRGEGIISMARAFSFAGTKCVIPSLWSIREHSTKELFEYFYNNLQTGMSKDVALRQAKFSLIKNTSKDEPFFWAGGRSCALSPLRNIEK